VGRHHVISDITGKTGMAIPDAIVRGERDPQQLAKLRDSRIKANTETVAKSLVGDYLPEHIFTLRQSLQSYRHYEQQIAEWDQEIAAMLARFDLRDSGSSAPAAGSLLFGGVSGVRVQGRDQGREFE
jgi:transposase